MKNKTPIQELISEFDLTDLDGAESLPTEVQQLFYFVVDKLTKIYIEKEKQFAFDCFEAGMKHQYCKLAYEISDATRFESFYAKYVEKHTN